MENLELMPMADFVLMQSEKMYTKVKDRVGESKYTVLQFITEVPNYANFLKQENAVWMFVPCDEEGNPLQKPEKENYTKEELESSDMGVDVVNYQEAKERCLFLVEDYEIDDDAVFFNDEEFIISRKTGHVIWRTTTYKTVEDLANDQDIKLYLSPRALKKIGV